MCVSYAPVQRQVLKEIFGVELPAAEWRAEPGKTTQPPSFGPVLAAERLFSEASA
ncbi:hypothetical protein DFLDMN_006420 (plasmid) [Cupriavidus sp. H19C3]|jgi:hypothetical protein